MLRTAPESDRLGFVGSCAVAETDVQPTKTSTEQTKAKVLVFTRREETLIQLIVNNSGVFVTPILDADGEFPG